MREQTSKHIIESGKSATSMAEEVGIETSTVCRWVRDYRRENKLSSWAEPKGIQPSRPQSEKDKQLKEEREKVDILKNPCTSSCKLTNEARSDS